MLGSVRLCKIGFKTDSAKDLLQKHQFCGIWYWFWDSEKIGAILNCPHWQYGYSSDCNQHIPTQNQQARYRTGPFLPLHEQMEAAAHAFNTMDKWPGLAVTLKGKEWFASLWPCKGLNHIQYSNVMHWKIIQIGKRWPLNLPLPYA